MGWRSVFSYRWMLLPVLGGVLIGFALTLAAFALGLPASYTDHSFDILRGLLSVGAVLALPAGLVAIVISGRRFHREKKELGSSIRRWAEGDLGHRAGRNGSAALYSLAEDLDGMAASMEQRTEAARRHSEEQIFQAEKLATTGRLAAGVAHEINNPLGGILLCGDLLLESTPPEDPRRENMTRIVTQAARARTIVRGLLDFARQSPPDVRRCDLNRVLNETLSLLERQPLYQRVAVRHEISRVPLWVRADAPKLQQVFINILMNALEAMREAGTLTVRTGFSERKGFCRVAVTDTGYGIPEANLQRIFEPFFTTKEVGQGIGLGLAIAYGIVQQHGGEIEVQTTVGSGTTFRVLLPLDTEE